MKIGTKSYLFGAHQFIIHPLFVAYAWYRLFGIPRDIRIWMSFFFHDIGYIGKSNINGTDGVFHPYCGARIMYHLFGEKWYEFCLFHSRQICFQINKPISKLCIADKFSIVIEPWWIYLPRVFLTGEIYEYLLHDYPHLNNYSQSKSKISNFIEMFKISYIWFYDLKKKLLRWIDDNNEVEINNYQFVYHSYNTKHLIIGSNHANGKFN